MNTMTCPDKNKKRFSDEQIKSLEIKFRADSRPESKSKQQLAWELGLEPRQVAVWFQNRRARSRTKQTEREYHNLKSAYDSLASKFESLKRENLELNKQLQDMESGRSENGEETKDEMARVSEEKEKDVEMEAEAEMFSLVESRDCSWTSSMDNWCGFDSSSYVWLNDWIEHGKSKSL